MSSFMGGPPNLPPELLLQLLSQGQGQQPAEQMSQQGQFNPADIQAQLQGGGGPQPFSFAPVQGGVGRNILNALAQAGKAATYVAEDPMERRAEDARAQQLYETKQKMAMAAGEFGQREKDRAEAAAQRKGEFSQKELDRQSALKIAQMGKETEAARLKEQERHNLATEGKPLKPDSPEQQFIDWYLQAHPGKNVGDAVNAYTKAHTPPEKPPKQLAVLPDNTVVDLGSLVGKKVPQGTRTATSELGKPSADEQRRADLAENMNENLNQLEDIVKRRPELFGQYGAGLLTSIRGKVGTGDPDIAKLGAIKEYLGMASVGAHSMRNAQHVGAAADAVMAGFRNSPEAMKAAIKMARDSTATFKQDLERSQGASAPPQQSQPSNGQRRVIDLTK